MTLEARAKLGDGGAGGDSEARSCAEWAPVADRDESGSSVDESGLSGPLSRRSVDLSTYPSARSFFEAVRDASVECERTREALLRMEAREGVRAQGYEAQGRSGHMSDRTAATDARIDHEARMAERIEADYAIIDLACRVLYGEESGKGGVDRLMGSAVADCISFRYVDARPWGEVAALLGYSSWSRRSLRDLCQRGFDAIDALGWERAIEGVGDAT